MLFLPVIELLSFIEYMNLQPSGERPLKSPTAFESQGQRDFKAAQEPALKPEINELTVWTVFALVVSSKGHSNQKDTFEQVISQI